MDFWNIFVVFFLLIQHAFALDELVDSLAVHANRTNHGLDGSNIDEASESFNLPKNALQDMFPSTKTLAGYLLWGGSHPTEQQLTDRTTTIRPETESVQTDQSSTTTADTTPAGAMMHQEVQKIVPLDIWTMPTYNPSPEDFSEIMATEAPSTVAPPKLAISNLGDFHNFSTNGVLAPMSLFHADQQSNLLMGNKVISFDANGNLTRTATIDTGNSTGRVVAVDSHTLPSKEATFLAIAQESSSGPGSVASVYLVAAENSYTLFTRIQTNSSISAMKLYSDHEGNIMLAMAERSFHCTTIYNSECGLSLIYKITGSGDAEISDAVKTGNATTVKLVDDTKSISLMYTTCETYDNGTETCHIINHFERPGMAPISSFQEFSCDPSNAEFFNMNGFSYYLGPSPTCDKHQISLWDNQMNFLNTFNTFDNMPDSWFIVNAGYHYCDASLIMAGVGKDGTTYYSLTSPGANYTKLLHDPQMSVAQMWSAGGNIYCVNKGAESLSLFKMTCPSSYIAQIGGQESDRWTYPTSSGYIDYYYSTTPLAPYTTIGYQYTYASAVVAPSVPGPEDPIVVYSVSTTPEYKVTDSLPHAVTDKTKQVGPFRFSLQNADKKSPATLYVAHLTQPFDMFSDLSVIVLTKNGSVLVVPPSWDLPCYRSGLLSLTAQKLMNVTAVHHFCNPAKNFAPGYILQFKAASHGGNIYAVSRFRNYIEFAAVIKDQSFFEVKDVPVPGGFTDLAVQICEGYPTVCVAVDTLIGNPPPTYSTEIRCFRMEKFRWKSMLNITADLASKVHVETYSRSERCMMVVESPGKMIGTNDLSIYVMKLTKETLQAIPSGMVSVDAGKPLDILHVQRTLWVRANTAHAATAEIIPNTDALFEIGASGVLDDIFIHRVALEKSPSLLAASRNFPACGGDLVVLQSVDFGTTNWTTDMFVVAARGGHAVTPLSYQGFPAGFVHSLHFALVEQRNFLLMKNGSLALVTEVSCVKKS